MNQKGFTPILLLLGIFIIVFLLLFWLGHIFWKFIPYGFDPITGQLTDISKLRELENEEGIRLQMPGAHNLDNSNGIKCGGIGERFGISTPLNATYGCGRFGTKASIKEVISFYDSHLTSLGWVKVN